MKAGARFLDEFRDPATAQKIVERIHRRSTVPARIMEFCGGHTAAILRNGIRQLLPPTLELVSGPGCPVCVTSQAEMDRALALAQIPGVILTTFGDLMKVPGSYGSLQEAKAEGSDVRVVYSTQDAMRMAREVPRRQVVFLAIGFETTAPSVALSILQAARENAENYFVLPLHKLTPPITRALLDSGEVRLQGILGPGHVTTVIGWRAWEFLPRDYRMPCAIAGFEPLDILHALSMLVEQIEEGKPRVDNAYPRSVRPEGNRSAQEAMERVFELEEADWRGMGVVPGSGLRLRQEYHRFDALSLLAQHGIAPGPLRTVRGCLCGEILRGVKSPRDCPLFGKACTPVRPLGPCMVSAEGSCAAYYEYGDGDER